MSARALEFVETWVSGKIEQMETLPAEGDEAAAKALANECFQAALDENIPAAEIQEAFDNLAEFIQGEVEEARERKEELWPAPGSADTELGVLMEPEVCHGETEVYTRVQA